MRAQKNIRLLNIYSVLTSMSFLIAVIIPFYRDEMGLGFKDFLIGEAAFAATLVLLEVPSGWLSDVWQRKRALALGALLEAVGYSCLLFGDGLLWAIIAQSVIGVGISLISGTNTAMLYDSLLSENRTEEFRKLEGRRAGLGYYSIAGASIASGFLYEAHHMLPIVLTVIGLSVCVISACMMEEPDRHKKRPEKHPVADMIETAHYALRGHAEVGLIILFASVMFCATKLIMWSQQPYYMNMGLRENMFGILMAAGFFLAGTSSQLGHRLDGKIGTIKSLAVVWAVAMLVCLVASIHVGWLGVALLMVGGSCLYGVGQPRVSEAINRRVGSERRATIISTQNLMVSLFFIPVSYVIGVLSDSYGVAGSLIGVAGWLGLGGLCLLFLVLRKGRRHMIML